MMSANFKMISVKIIFHKLSLFFSDSSNLVKSELKIYFASIFFISVFIFLLLLLILLFSSMPKLFEYIIDNKGYILLMISS